MLQLISSHALGSPVYFKQNKILAQSFKCVVARTFSSTDSFVEEISTPITIVGGGPTGIFLSALLSHFQVPSILLEARTESQLLYHPQGICVQQEINFLFACLY